MKHTREQQAALDAHIIKAWCKGYSGSDIAYQCKASRKWAEYHLKRLGLTVKLRRDLTWVRGATNTFEERVIAHVTEIRQKRKTKHLPLNWQSILHNSG